MTILLQINSGMKGDQSFSSQLADQLAVRLKSANAPIRHIRHDLCDESLPHLNNTTFDAFSCSEETLTEEQKALLAPSDRYIDELRHADILILGVPMYNFMIPSTLKCWIDHVTRAGKSFQFTDTGPVGLLEDRQCYICIARGGFSSDGATDLMKNYLRMILNFLGIKNIEFLEIEGLAQAKDTPDLLIKNSLKTAGISILEGA